jgi:hypothetical protein
MWPQTEFEPIVKADKTKVEKSKERAHWINALKYFGLGPSFVITSIPLFLGNFQDFFFRLCIKPKV